MFEINGRTAYKNAYLLYLDRWLWRRPSQVKEKMSGPGSGLVGRGLWPINHSISDRAIDLAGIFREKPALFECEQLLALLYREELALFSPEAGGQSWQSRITELWKGKAGLQDLSEMRKALAIELCFISGDFVNQECFVQRQFPPGTLTLWQAVQLAAWSQGKPISRFTLRYFREHGGDSLVGRLDFAGRWWGRNLALCHNLGEVRWPLNEYNLPRLRFSGEQHLFPLIFELNMPLISSLKTTILPKLR
jgi:hypothetical protein